MIPNLSINKQSYIRKLRLKKFRRLEGTFICEGFRLFDAAVQSNHIIIREIVVSEEIEGSSQWNYISDEADNLSVPLYRVESKVMKSLSTEVTPPGILFTVQKKLLGRSDISAEDSDAIVYLDRISDPGNLGTIMRSSAWFGVTHIALSPGCVDPHNSKSVRASAGAVFNLNLYENIDFNWLKMSYKNRDYKFVATASAKGIPLEQWKTVQKSIIFFGQEASGLSEEIIEAADTIVRIQRIGQVESLNLSVAAGIILNHFAGSGLFIKLN